MTVQPGHLPGPGTRLPRPLGRPASPGPRMRGPGSAAPPGLRRPRPCEDHPARSPSRDSYLPQLAHWPMNAEYSACASANSPLAKRSWASARAAGVSWLSRSGGSAMAASLGWKRNHSGPHTGLHWPTEGPTIE